MLPLVQVHTAVITRVGSSLALNIHYPDDYQQALRLSACALNSAPTPA